MIWIKSGCIYLLSAGFVYCRVSFCGSPSGRTIDEFIRKGIMADRDVYGIVRNPIYAGIFFVFSGLCLASHTLLIILCLLPVYLILKILLIREDKIMTETFGDRYLDYKKRVNSVLPNPVKLMSAWFYPAETSVYNRQLFVIRDRDVNIFIYSDGKQYICIDTGYSAGAVKKQFEELGIDAGKVSSVFLTHTDMDHRNGLELFKQADLYIGNEEEQMIDGRKKRKLFYSNKPLDRQYKLLYDGDTVFAEGIKIRAVSTPGHTCGHTAYIIDEKILFTGDSIIYQNGEIKPFYRLINMNHSEAAASSEKIKRIIEDGVELICTAHTGVINTGQ